MKKLISLIAAVMVLCLLFTSCSGGTATTEKLTPDNIKADTVVFECAGQSITYDEYAYMLLSYKTMYEYYYGEDFWTTTDGEAMAVYIRSYVDEYLQETCGFLKWADELGIKLEDTDEYTVENQYQAAIDNYGSEEALIEAMEGANCNKELYLRLIEENLIISKLQTYVSENMIEGSDEEIIAWAEENGYVRVQHVLIKNDEDDDADANKALAEDIKKRADEGEDFLSLVKEYSEDTEENFESGYTFNEDNSMMEAFSTASLALEEGQISDIVEIDDYYVGYHIIKRVPLRVEDVKDYYNQTKFYEIYDKTMDGQLEITYPGEFNTFAFTDFKYVAAE